MSQIYNRELSWLQFNDRVMQEARDVAVPLVQRLRFLGIFSNNQDEFIRVRLANLLRLAGLKGKNLPALTGGFTAGELLPLIDRRMQVSRELFIETWSGVVSELEAHGVRIVDEAGLTEEQVKFCRAYFHSTVSVRLVPLMLRKSVEIPFLPDGEIFLAVRMAGRTSSDRITSRYAIVQIPVSDACPRFVVLPSEAGRTDVIFLDDIIRLCLDDIFFMFSYDSISAHTFRIVRDAEFTLDDDVSKSMPEKMFQGLLKRQHGRPVRMIYDRAMSDDVLQTITRKLAIRDAGQLEPGGRYHQMRDLMRFPAVRPELEETRAEPMNHPLIDPSESIIRVMRRQDVLLCYPYHTFKHFIDLLREAAVDPRVQSIRITLYRTAHHSKVIHTLISAAQNGKQVTALVELKARFDEGQNIEVTDTLQNGGVKVVHSLEELKVHSKLLLIERKETSGALRGYLYVGTGNFNEDTTRIYGDFGLLTSDEVAVDDARRLFDFLQNTHRHPVYRRLLVSPYYMRGEIEAIIDGEIRNARKGRPAWIHAKFNSLTDERMVEKLYEASRAGVEIKLLVRGSCCLIAGEKGQSENIEVRSIIDKYLEHARLIIASNGGKPRSWILSADLMTRNLDRRVEAGIPIRDRGIHSTLVDYFDIQWSDNTKARVIAPPFENTHVSPTPSEAPHRSQTELYKYFESKNR
jgi:polyphosphate kinase